MQEYYFRGTADYSLLTSDARKDDLFAFIVVEPNEALLGITEEYGYTPSLFEQYKLGDGAHGGAIHANGYRIFPISKKEIPRAIKASEAAKKKVLKNRRKAARAARKRADKTENKVMTFREEPAVSSKVVCGSIFSPINLCTIDNWRWDATRQNRLHHKKCMD